MTRRGKICFEARWHTASMAATSCFRATFIQTCTRQKRFIAYRPNNYALYDNFYCY
jgi:hypothetical protein